MSSAATAQSDPPALVAFRELASVLADPSLAAIVDGFELQAPGRCCARHQN